MPLPNGNKLASLAVAAIASLSIASAASAPANAADSLSADSETVAPAGGAELSLETADSNGFQGQVEQGTVAVNDDGSVTIKGQDGREAAILQTDIVLDDGSSRQVSYAVEDNVVTAEYSEAIEPDQGRTPSDPSGAAGMATATGNGVDCGLAVAGAGAAYLGASERL